MRLLGSCLFTLNMVILKFNSFQYVIQRICYGNSTVTKIHFIQIEEFNTVLLKLVIHQNIQISTEKTSLIVYSDPNMKLAVTSR